MSTPTLDCAVHFKALLQLHIACEANLETWLWFHFYSEVSVEIWLRLCFLAPESLLKFDCWLLSFKENCKSCLRLYLQSVADFKIWFLTLLRLKSRYLNLTLNPTFDSWITTKIWLTSLQLWSRFHIFDFNSSLTLEQILKLDSLLHCLRSKF